MSARAALLINAETRSDADSEAASDASSDKGGDDAPVIEIKISLKYA